ncbi:hypothetical protein [Synechocystis sp. PCC 7509]|uniref:hypothetical protein n=1 Tax=Synechocystis sp. PCC 7509 TaxID=927677 RepID=UPI00031AA3D5|nr:hypothetical protein [Synechocystis sp. PCC 7509]
MVNCRFSDRFLLLNITSLQRAIAPWFKLRDFVVYIGKCDRAFITDKSDRTLA